MTTKPDKPQIAPCCDCGCGAATRGGRYLPGHDAKHKKQLIDDALHGSKRAESKLAKLGWTKFLEAKRQVQAKPGRKPRTADHPVATPPRRRGRPPKSGFLPVEHAVHAPGFDTGSGAVEQ